MNYTTKKLLMRLLPVDLIERIRFIGYDFQKAPPILVYSFGKVGSSSVYLSMKKAGLKNVFHIHTLNRERWKNAVQRCRTNKTYVRHHLIVSKWLMKKLRESGIVKPVVVTMVREPIGRKISSFFQNANITHKDAIRNGTYSPEVCRSKITRLLLQQGSAYTADMERWFEEEINRVFGIDVFSEVFDPKKGFCIIENSQAKVVVFRMEDMSRCFTEAMQLLFPNTTIPMIRKNVSDNKEYRYAYDQVRKSIALPKNCLDDICQSRLCRHFYRDQLQEIKNKWLAKSEDSTARS